MPSPVQISNIAHTFVRTTLSRSIFSVILFMSEERKFAAKRGDRVAKGNMESESFFVLLCCCFLFFFIGGKLIEFKQSFTHQYG